MAPTSCCRRRFVPLSPRCAAFRVKSLATKRALLAAPRAFLRQVLGDEADTTVVEDLFRETLAWSDRVIGLGLWRTRVLPWIELPSNDWFGAARRMDEASTERRPKGRGLLLNDRTVPLTADEAEQLHAATEAAIAKGDATVNFTSGGETFTVPATAETLVALSALRDANLTPSHATAAEADR